MGPDSPVLDYYDLSPSVTAFNTTRCGGVSRGEYGGFNINRYCGDDEACIKSNLEMLGRELNVKAGNIIMPHQTHDCEVRQIGGEFLTLPDTVKAKILEGVDALTTNVRDICIGVSTADCIPIIIYDPEHHAAATVHAGWRGTVKRIAQKAIASMALSYQSRPQNLYAVIGPGISLEAFEVGDDVYNEFDSAGFDMSTISSRRDKWHIDLKECNLQQLIQTGLVKDKITVSPICTYNTSTKYFSARKLGIKSGRIFTGIVLR